MGLHKMLYGQQDGKNHSIGNAYVDISKLQPPSKFHELIMGSVQSHFKIKIAIPGQYGHSASLGCRSRALCAALLVPPVTEVPELQSVSSGAGASNTGCRGLRL